MKIILATTNKGKVKELKEMLKGFELAPFDEVLEPFEIIEDGDSFAKNALIKARAIFDKLKTKENIVVLADDSGISVPVLGGEPGIFSARYAKEGASDRENLNKLVKKLQKLNLTSTKAYYTAAIAVVSSVGEYVAHGWMWGEAITTPRGDKGFGYDPMFIPDGFDKTLGELDSSIKKELSHRAKAINNIKPILDMLKKRIKDD